MQYFQQCLQCLRGQHNVEQADPFVNTSGREKLVKEEEKVVRPHTDSQISDKAKISDFNQHGDDVKKVSQKQLDKMNRYQKFEHLFPFYQMDVNGYILRIKQAMELEEPGNKLWLINQVSL